MKAAKRDDVRKQWTQSIPFKEFYTVQDVSIILNVGSPAIYGAIRRMTLQGYRVNGVTAVKHEDLVSYIAGREVQESVEKIC